MAKELSVAADCVELAVPDGVAFVAQASPLTRLHYFDGQYLRADALALEQDYLRARDRLANLAGGWGVVNGLGVSLAGATLKVSAGLAVTSVGSLVLAVDELSAALSDLLAVAKARLDAGNADFADCPPVQPKIGATPATLAYEITVGPLQTLCGNEAVYGKLCATACAGDSQHPYWREGVVLRLRPIALKLPESSAVDLGSIHLRNRAVSAYFAAEPWLTASLLSSAGLAGATWCNPASLYGRDEVPIGLVIIEGTTVRVLDAWSARRERMDTQARGYWHGRMAMRPWNVFLAQILQFQCQLAGVFDAAGGTLQLADDCGDLRALLDATRKQIDALHQHYTSGAQSILKRFTANPTEADAQTLSDAVTLTYAQLYELSGRLAGADLGKGALPKNRLLTAVGFVELPPAGYLPVAPGKQSLEDQLARMFGEGVRLHYAAVRHDEIAHLVEEAQHMERISLTRGLDDPTRIEDVEIFVPDGEAYGAAQAAPGEWWQLEMELEAVRAFDLGLESTRVVTSGGTLEAHREVLEEAAEVGPVHAEDAAGVASAAAAVDGATQEAVQAELAKLVQSLQSRPLQGLARTEERADGSYGLTLVARLDADDVLAQMRALLEKYPDIDAKGTVAKQIARFGNLAVYVAGDVAADPLALPLNGSAALSGELALGAAISQVTGSLSVLFDRPLGSGRSERVAQLSLVLVDAQGNPTARRGRISLARQGDGSDGECVLDDADHDPSTSPDLFTWQSAPRTASFAALDDAGKQPVILKLMREASAAGLQINSNVSAASGDATAAGSARAELAKLYGLPAMPTLDSALGAAALNTLIRIAEPADAPAFLARARSRLFPTLDTPLAERVRAVRDWVMFRRARTRLCCPRIPVTPVGPALEAVQLWHALVADAAQSKALQAVLERNDAEALAGFDFQRVGVLRYRDESTVAEEPEAQIEAMWRAVDTGPQVLFARYWEQAPTTGQGWQNHFRLSGMLDQISDIVASPPRGQGAITGLLAVSPPLSDGAVDGGFLVVTQAGGDAVTREALLIYTNWDRPNHFANADAPHTDVGFADNIPQGSTLADFIAVLTPNQPVLGVTIATTRAAPDSGAVTRMQAVVAALVAAGRPAPVATRQTIAAINDHDREEIEKLGIDSNGYDEVIFLEPNAGN